MKNCIIFGCGFYGKAAFYKLSLTYNVLYYADNNSEIWGNDINGIRVISPDELYRLYDENDTDIIICCRPYMEIYRQLARNGITACYSMVEGFMYQIDSDETPYPVSLMPLAPYKKSSRDEKNILFVQNTACIRTHKFAAVMSTLGYKVFLLYTMAPPKYNNGSFEKYYSDIFTASTADEIVKFVNNSEFDIVHSSNEPDLLTSILVGTNKKIVFDTHDMMSMRGYVSVEHLAIEYIATSGSDGLIHVSQGCLDYAKRKYDLNDKPILCLGNYPLRQYEVSPKAKLSETDGEIHCVYEGGMTFSDKTHARYMKDIWKPIIDAGIHIHFYTNADERSCREYADSSRYLHYEGNFGTEQLIEEMTKYDCGLALFNINGTNRRILENSSANKIYEYLNAGLPVFSSNLKYYASFLSEYNVGRVYDTKQDVYEQLLSLKRISIPKNFLNDNKLTFESEADNIEMFYNKVKNGEV